MNPAVGTLSFRTGDRTETMPFSRLHRLTLTTLKRIIPKDTRSLTNRPDPPDEREYRLKSVAIGRGTMVGRTVGYVQAREGMYLFPPDRHGTGVQRIFVPLSAYSDYQFGPFTEDVPRVREIADPEELLTALERQQHMRVLPIGHSLIALGLITQAQLASALATQPKDLPLGEMLVSSKLISRANLEMALAHKMGYPLIDLVHFPIAPKALQLLTLPVAIAKRVVPVLVDGSRLIVAVSGTSRAAKLHLLEGPFKLRVVPVLAPKNRILETLTRMSQHQTWASVPLSMRFFETTSS